jgi:hypothetical protein
MAFNILDHVQLNAKNRAQCPACMANGKTGLNLSVAGSGAYKCFRGCTPDDIRAALGAERPGRAAQVAPPPKPSGITSAQVDQAHERLLNSKHALPWLLERGICREAIVHYRLGAARAKVSSGHLPAIAVPIPVTDDRWGQKKRIAPWMTIEQRTFINDKGKPEEAPHWAQSGISATVYSTNTPTKPEAVWLCEGEWDAIRLGWAVKHSELADAIHVASFTCGAGNIPPLMEVDRLPNVPIVALYDLDDPGRAGAKKLQDRLKDRVLVATVPAPPSAKDGWDISDALAHGYGIEAINEAAAAAVAWVEPKRANPLRDRLVTNDELVANAQDFVDWLVPDILTADELFILGMPPRGGKSLFGLTLAKAIATGGNFLDRPVTQGSVIYINLEDSPTKIKQRQALQGWSEGLPVWWMEKFKLSELPDLQELADEIPDLRLVVLDTFSRVRDDTQKESSAELGKILEPLQEWAKERGICILITHHTGKANIEHASADPFDSLRGSTSIRATCRGAIVIVPAEQGYRLLAENGYSDRMDLNVRINPETLEWKLCGNWTPRVDGDMKAQILDHLNLHGEATVAEIASDLSFNAASVSTVMSRLHRDDMVTKIGGKGRIPARYTRCSNLLKQQSILFEHPNPDPAKDVALLKQNNLSKEPTPKVINGAESDQCVDHFEQKAPTHIKLFEQSCNPDPVSVPCSNSTTPEFEQVGTTPPNPPNPGEKVRYCGENWQKQKILGRKQLTVTGCTQNDEGWWVTAEHPALMVPQTLALSDVKLIQS